MCNGACSHVASPSAIRFAAIVLIIISFNTSHAAPPPDSGSLLQQNQPPKPPVPVNNSTGLKFEPPDHSNLPPSAPFMVRQIEISGNTVFATETLHKLVANLEGQEHTLAELNAAVDQISDYYYKHGYPLARAYIPAQTLQDGLLKIRIIEARYGSISLHNASDINDDTIKSVLSPLRSQDRIEQGPLDRALLLLSDMPGLVSGATLEPGSEVGTSDLNIETQATPALTANALLDNNGNTYTGRTRLNATLNWANPFHQSDVFSANLLSTGPNLDSIGLTYETLASGEGDRVGGMASFLHYRLGDGLSELKGHGTAQTGSLWWRYPWVRSTDLNLNLQFQLDYKSLKDEIDSSSIDTSRHLDVGQFMLSGDLRNADLAGGLTSFSMIIRAGDNLFDNAAAQTLDQKTAHAEGGFAKANIIVNRLQNLLPDTAVNFLVSAQWAHNNLDSSEKMIAGGASSVRAYDTAVLSGDRGLLASLELRQNLALSWGGTWQAVAFADGQGIKINQNPWAAGSNSARLYGTGLGLNWNNDGGWHFKLTASAPTGAVPDLLKIKRSVRTWAELGVWF